MPEFEGALGGGGERIMVKGGRDETTHDPQLNMYAAFPSLNVQGLSYMGGKKN
jgi:hypothetical protein